MKRVTDIGIYISILIGVIAITVKGVWLAYIWPLSILLWTSLMVVYNRKSKKMYWWIFLLLISVLLVFSTPK